MTKYIRVEHPGNHQGSIQGTNREPRGGEDTRRRRGQQPRAQQDQLGAARPPGRLRASRRPADSMLQASRCRRVNHRLNAIHVCWKPFYKAALRPREKPTPHTVGCVLLLRPQLFPRVEGGGTADVFFKGQSTLGALQAPGLHCGHSR